MKHTVQSLRQSGHKVRVIHSRHLDFHIKCPATPKDAKNPPYLTIHELREQGLLKAVSARGGKTFVQITKPDGSEVFSEALCSLKDNFDRKLGVQIALGRLNLE
jgi:hypothetical protein